MAINHLTDYWSRWQPTEELAKNSVNADQFPDSERVIEEGNLFGDYVLVATYTHEDYPELFI